VNPRKVRYCGSSGSGLYAVAKMAWELERDYPMPFRDLNAPRTIAGVYPDIARHMEHGKPVSLPTGKAVCEESR